VRNRSHTPPPPRDEDEFIKLGTASQPVATAGGAKARTKTFPVTVSLTEANLNDVKTHLQYAAVQGEVSMSRTDVMKAGLLALKEFTPEQILEFMRKVKV